MIEFELFELKEIKKRYKEFLSNWPKPDDDYSWVYEDGELELTIVTQTKECEDV